jgi:uncharacterized repeat protein (TIGR02543 family)
LTGAAGSAINLSQGSKVDGLNGKFKDRGTDFTASGEVTVGAATDAPSATGMTGGLYISDGSVFAKEVITHTATLNINRDGAPFTNFAGVYQLRLNGNETTTVSMTGSGAVMTASVTDGTWKVYEQISGEHFYTGVDITVSGGASSATLDYYTVNYTVTDNGAASGSSVSLNVNGYDMGSSISGSTYAVKGGEVILTAAGAGAASYAYAWSGTNGANPISGTGATLTISNVTGIITVACTVTGSNPGTGGGGGGTTYYTVKFEADGGNAVKSVSVSGGGKVSKPADPTKEGYAFDGWYSGKDFKTEYDFNKSVTGNITVYAKWTENTKPVEPMPTEWENPFADVKTGDWFYGDVEYAYENGLFEGTDANTFEPNTSMSRAMLVTVLWRVAESPAASGNSQFTDVSDGAYYAEAVKWAAANGMISGIGNGLFAPDTAITRQDMAVILARYMDYAKVYYTVTDEYRVFADETAISGYAKNAVQILNKLGIINGKGNNVIDPQGAATRAEVAAMLHRFLEREAV